MTSRLFVLLAVLLLAVPPTTWCRTMESTGSDDESASSDDSGVEASLEKLEDFKGVEKKLDRLFDTFDDVINEQSKRPSNKESDRVNEKLYEVIEDAEDLDDDIADITDYLKEDDYDYSDSNSDTSDDYDYYNDDDYDDETEEEYVQEDIDIMEEDADALRSDAKRLVDSVLKNPDGSQNTKADPVLKVELQEVKEKADDVLKALAKTEGKIKDRLNKRQQWTKEEAAKYGFDMDGYQGDMARGPPSPPQYSPNRGDDHSIKPIRLENDPWPDTINDANGDHNTGMNGDTAPPAPPPSDPLGPSNGADFPSNDGHASGGHGAHSPMTRLAMLRREADQLDDMRRREIEMKNREAEARRPNFDTTGFSENFGRSNNQYYNIDGLERYLNTCKECVGLTEKTTCPLNNQVLEMKKWANELQELLSFGCKKPESCTTPGICCVKDDFPFEQTVVQMTQMLKDVYSMMQDRCSRKCFSDPQKYVLGTEWKPWAEWTPCDVTCGQGVRERRRDCQNEGQNGIFCDGDSKELELCKERDCCVDGNWVSWSSWSTCSVTCGSGSQERRRTCSNPLPNYCGQNCAGSGRDIRDCRGPADCCVDGQWNTWTRWSQCSATCGRGVASRQRLCSRPRPNLCGADCQGDATQEKQCGNQQDCCVDGNWGSWRTWTSCSVSCGNGMRSRVRRCDFPAPNFCGQRCQGMPQEQASCYAGQCCQDGNWSSWGSWDSCSTTCGAGNQLRRRRCDSPPANSCGQECSGRASDIRDCNEGSCCVDGNWGTWQRWSTCSVSCGTGRKTRSRMCDRPRPDRCGMQCQGSADQEDICDSGTPCQTCVDGNWGTWQQWSTCSSTCGEGRRERSRLCDAPGANFCGQDCFGMPNEVDTCFGLTAVDGQWGSWSTWSSCSASCGRGQRERSRMCKGKNSCGRTCPGSPLDVEDCESASCIDCGVVRWTSWSTWSRCSATCDVGMRKRSRQCSNPNPLDCRDDRYCVGDTSQQEPCGSGRPCCDDVTWSTWTSWSQCSAACGKGTNERRRRCLNSKVGCDDYCRGGDREERPCENTRCCDLVGWSTWASWSPCSATCDRGVQERSRRCDNAYPEVCDKERYCYGSNMDERSCDSGRSCCVDGNWSSWASWSYCSVTCGVGTKERRRRCNNPPADFCGRPCDGPEIDEDRCDTGRQCEPECEPRLWATWSPWATCNGNCGQETVARYRVCRTPTSRSCVEECTGVTTDSKIETCGPTPVDGNWGSWSSWGACTASCGPGQRIRSRLCNRPRANQCGRQCPGLDEDVEACDDGPCAQCALRDWTSWGSWSSCSTTCGPARRNRLRYCDFPNLDSNVVDCGARSRVNCRAGDDFQDEECRNNLPCPAVERWSQWGACSLTCRGSNGVRQRYREIRQPDGTYIFDTFSQADLGRCSVDTPECPTWGSWSSCSATCRGQGVRERVQYQRTSLGSLEALASTKETQSCTVDGPVCPSSVVWASWGACSVTCRGEGIRERRARSTTNLGSLDADASQVQRERCFVDSPECPAWSQWGACSATCNGEGVRERTLIFRTDLGNIVADATQKQTESCSVTNGPDCPSGSLGYEIYQAFWSTWAKWCPCDCRTGKRSRRRECMQDDPKTGIVKNVPLSYCSGGAAREERNCDVIGVCPECITTCQNKPDGIYASCSGCADFIKCVGGSGETNLMRCTKPKTAFDAFVSKCVSAPSPSCSLQDCVTSCEGMADGQYHSCSGCSSFVECRAGQFSVLQCPAQGMEYNGHFGTCIEDRSPTCKRPVGSDRPEDRTFNDAPADEYYDEKNGMNAEERREMFEKSRKKTPGELAELKEEMMAGVNEVEVEEEGDDDDGEDVEERGLLDQMTDFIYNLATTPSPTDIPNCISSCVGQKRGRHPSCRDCRSYWQCYKSGYREKKCRKDKVWDNRFKECRKTSSTCPGN